MKAGLIAATDSRVVQIGESDAEVAITRSRRLVRPWQAAWLAIFWTTFGGTLVAIAWLSLIPRQQTFDTGAARNVRQIGPNAFEAEFPGRIPQECLVGCGGFELAKADSTDEVFKKNGCYWTDADRGLVHWSPKTNLVTSASHSAPSAIKIPVAVLVVPGDLSLPLGSKLLWFLIPAGVLALSAFALASGRESEFIGLFTHDQDRSRIGRGILVGAVGFGLAFAMVPDWNRLVTCPDSRSYVENHPIRTPFTGWWLAAFDSQRNMPRAESVPAERRTISHFGPTHRNVTAVRAWKVLFVISVCVLAYWLTTIVPWWTAAPLLLAAAVFDGSRGPWSSGMSGYLDVLLSEPLSDSLMFLSLASLLAYFEKPTWTRGALLAVCLNLLILARPASVVFAAVIGAIWMLQYRREGLGIACRRAGVIALLLLGGIALHCTFNYFEYGHFRQHAFAGMNLMTTALQIADSSDADSFADPKTAEFAQLAIAKACEKRHTPFGASAADANCWQIAVPAYAAVCGVTAEQQPFAADDVLTRVARGIIRRHPREFLELAATSFRNGFWRTWIHLPLLLAVAVGLSLFWRTGDWRFLFVACVALLPFVAVIPACVTNYPIDRYRSLTSFAEIWSVPLCIGVALSAWAARSRKVIRNPDAPRIAEQARALGPQLARL